MLGRALRITAGTLALGLVAGVGYLLISPPDLLRVGTNYSAKIVCSNVFIARRDAQEVLAVDVQAPGHPLLKHVSVSVDPEAQSVSAKLLGIFAPATSQYREGLGCANTHEAQPVNAQLNTLPALSDALWPEGTTVAPAQNSKLAMVLSDPTILGKGFRAVVVVHDGRIIGEAYADGFDENTPLLGWSMTKTITSGLIGTLIKSGQMKLTDTLVDSFPDWAEDNRQHITVEDMLTMSSGLRWNEGYGDVSDVTRMLYLSDDMAGFVTSLEAEAEPNTEFNYSSGTSTVLARVWQDQVKDDSLSYPQRALLLPLGMTSAILETDVSDTFVGSSYMYATARDWARYGQFLLQGGTWDGQQILPEGFTDWMFEPVAVSGGAYAKGHLWRDVPGGEPPFEDAVWMAGHDGQSVGIFPSRDLVIVRLGLTPSDTGYSPLPLAKAVITALGS